MEYREIDSANRPLMHAFLREHWFSTTMVLRGREIDMTQAEGFFAQEGEHILGLVTYLVTGDVLEILSLDSLRENQGIVLITTNDNLRALQFYQKRGFDMAHLFRGALEVSRKLKPEIPLIGAHGIPLRHEIEFEMLLSKEGRSVIQAEQGAPAP